jgi:hypothetical protein
VRLVLVDGLVVAEMALFGLGLRVGVEVVVVEGVDGLHVVDERGWLETGVFR